MVTWRHRMARLSEPGARRAFGRAWLAICVAGAIITLGLAGGQHFFIVTAIWLVCIFVPVRIAVESLHTFGPRLHDALHRDMQHRPDRYDTREHLTVMVELLYEREVKLPRLSPPGFGGKVIDAAVGLCHRISGRGAGPLGVSRVVTTCSALLDRWVGAIAAGECGTPPSSGSAAAELSFVGGSNGASPPTLWDPTASVQDQWVALRAVAGLGALTKVLIAVYEDSTGQHLEGGTALRTVADAAMDYVDQVGLRLDGPPWETVPGAPLALPQDLVARLAETWMAFCQAPSPAPRRLKTFIEAMPE